MQLVDGRIVLSPTDLTKHLGCPHITTLDVQAARTGQADEATGPDDALQLIFRKGLEHEQTYLDVLRSEGRTIVKIQTRFDEDGRRLAERETVAAMRSGVDVIYQATFYDGSWGGQADFLLRQETPSSFGAWSYEIADTKLARRLKVAALLQMATYADRLAVLQGVAPKRLTVITGDGKQHAWRLVDVAAYARGARRRMETAVKEANETQAVPVWQCSQCRWTDLCKRRWEADDDLSLVAGMRGSHRQALRLHGIDTMSALSTSTLTKVSGVGRASWERLTQQAGLQVAERASGQPVYRLLQPVAGKGLLRLPTPSEGDVYLDFEGDPFAGQGSGREYLAGLWERSGAFTSWWAHTDQDEARLTEALLDALISRWRTDPGMHIYHYAPYEVTALKRLTGRHATRERELDSLLRAERFVDLYAVVRQGLRISKPSYSIKKLEDFYWDSARTAADGGVVDAMSSIVEYERYLVERDEAILTRIEAYNREDVRSTHDLHSWLESLRAELEAATGPAQRPVPAQDDRQAASSQAELDELDLAERLQSHGQRLLAGLVGWHRREERPAWWDVFRLQDLDDEELVEDSTPLGGLSAPECVGEVARSNIWRYRFPPQDCRLAVGRETSDVDLTRNVGEVTGLDAVAGWVDVKIGKRHTAPAVRGLGPPGPVNTTVLRQSIAHVAEQVLAGQSPLGRMLIERRVPARLVPSANEQPRDVVLRVGPGMRGEVLAVQGPPGSGKTTVGAELIRRLLDEGQRVGVTAQSHAVVGNLLKAVGRPALQKCDEDQFCGVAGVTHVTTNEAVLGQLTQGANLVGGSAWLWARAEMRGLVDVLVIDEAGQFSLANAVAVSTAASSLVLLGDPQQLTSPTQAVHPDGAGESALAHLIQGHDTIPPECGVFLDTTWRLHPAIAEFVSVASYDSRLHSAPGRERQRIHSEGGVSGSGLRWLPVVHSGNASSSQEEAEVVGRLVGHLLRGSWTDCDEIRRPVTGGDVLVVAPYNRQVAALRGVLPGDVAAGTVDKFQGREAAVVIYSMASSSAADAPRGVDFLYDLHRLNVAVSRARALTVVVASPALLGAEVHSPEQLRQVNALCLYAELAEQVQLAEQVEQARGTPTELAQSPAPARPA